MIVGVEGCGAAAQSCGLLFRTKERGKGNDLVSIRDHLCDHNGPADWDYQHPRLHNIPGMRDCAGRAAAEISFLAAKLRNQTRLHSREIEKRLITLEGESRA